MEAGAGGIRPSLFRIGDDMSTQQEFYLERASEARASAGAATLNNVRHRWLLSEATWTEMAARSERGEKMRGKMAGQALGRTAIKAEPQG